MQPLAINPVRSDPYPITVLHSHRTDVQLTGKLRPQVAGPAIEKLTQVVIIDQRLVKEYVSFDALQLLG